MTSPAPLQLRVTLRRGLRAWWDHLGLACLGSAAWLMAALLPWAMADRMGWLQARGSAPWIIVTALASLAGHALVWAGLVSVAHDAVARDEVGSAKLLDGFRRFPVATLALGFLQGCVVLMAAVNLAFYAALRSPVGSVLAVLLGYAMLFWLMNCQYHWPLLVASQSGLITRDDGRTPGLRSVLRNAFVLAMGSPAYSLGLTVVLGLLGLALTLTGIGLALVAPALTAFLSAQALRDHLVQRGMVAPPQDEGSTPTDTWRVPM